MGTFNREITVNPDIDINIGDSVTGNWNETGEVSYVGHRGVVVHFDVGGLVFWDWLGIGQFWTGGAGGWKIIIGT